MTAKKLQMAGCCPGGVESFRARWPHGMPLTVRNVERELLHDRFHIECALSLLTGHKGDRAYELPKYIEKSLLHDSTTRIAKVMLAYFEKMGKF
jgi:hypothetical protein